MATAPLRPPIQKGIDVSQHAHRLCFLLLLALAAPAVQARADSAAAISFAEQPVRLLRATSFYVATRGVRLQDGDIIETGAGSIQVDGAGASTLAVGPASRVYFKLGAGGLALTLLDGWLKIQPGAVATAGATPISAGALQFNAAGNAVIVHVEADKTELFVESGEAGVVEKVGNKALAPLKVGREQFAVRSAKLPLKVLPRASKDFLGGMPPAFFDKLIPVAAKGPVPAPKLDKAALFSDVAPWLSADSALYQQLDRRFNPPKAVPAVAVPAAAPPPPRPETHLY